MTQTLLLGIGTGRCGTLSLVKILNRQPDTRVTHEARPLMPWVPHPRGPCIGERLARIRATRPEGFVGDVASFYLPYLDEALRAEPGLRVVCLKRPRDEVVRSFCKWLDAIYPLPINHWARQPAPGWHHEPDWSRIFPRYDTQDREEGIRRYWDEYYQAVDDLVRDHSENLRVFNMEPALNTEEGLRELLTFIGIPAERQVIAPGTRAHQSAEARRRPSRPLRVSGNPNDPGRCVVLVLHSGNIVPACEKGLRELERRGYSVRRVGGYAAVDQGRNQLATDALLDGFEETVWIDADIGFEADAVDRLRAHRLPLVSGIYAQKGKQAVACHVLPGTPDLVFGEEGGLKEILYAGAGFLLVRREVYLNIQERLLLPMCNERFAKPMLPFFQPMLHFHEGGHWYLAEDYAFCQRARACGYKIMADTTIRLWHFGAHGYGWEDTGVERPRYGSFTLHLPGANGLAENVKTEEVVEGRGS